MPEKQYIGRFAPSPTGRLHFGSLVAALASFADAQQHQGQWLLRIDDIDQAREINGSADDIIVSLETFGFAWDQPVYRQSQHTDYYQHYFEQLKKQGLVYPCNCSRKQIAELAKPGVDGYIYPNTCKNKPPSSSTSNAWRLDVSQAKKQRISDLIQPDMEQQLNAEVGDFIILRKDQFFAYQFAVVLDDFQQNISHVIRGADIYLSTPRQTYLQQLLGFNRPVYAHIPLANDKHGKKISKSDQAIAIDNNKPLPSLLSAWVFLGQEVIDADNIDSFWKQAIALWDIRKMPATNNAYQ